MLEQPKNCLPRLPRCVGGVSLLSSALCPRLFFPLRAPLPLLLVGASGAALAVSQPHVMIGRSRHDADWQASFVARRAWERGLGCGPVGRSHCVQLEQCCSGHTAVPDSGSSRCNQLVSWRAGSCGAEVGCVGCCSRDRHCHALSAGSCVAASDTPAGIRAWYGVACGCEQ